MVDALRIGLSALLAQQRALAVTSNNIANAATPGYSRQRAELDQLGVEHAGNGFVGTGVRVDNIRRFTDEFLLAQMHTAASALGRSTVFGQLAGTLDSLLADERTGLNATLQDFFNAIQDVADDPGSASARQVLLSEAQSLASRFDTTASRIESLNGEVTARITADVTEINGIGRSLATLNGEILTSGGSSGQVSPELLDQRDRLLSRLSELVEFDTAVQSDGTIGVFMGTGQVLVIGTTSADISVAPGRFDPREPEIVLTTATGSVEITSFLTGGELGGLLDFRREMLNPMGSSIGQIALGLAEVFNAAHREGMDLNGQLGGDFFGVPAPLADAASTNAGTATVAAAVTDIGELEATNYRLYYDGSAYSLVRTDSGAAVAMTGTGTAGDPFVADGLSLVLSGASAAGDEFLIQPLEHVGAGLSVLIGDPASIAVAAPTRTSAAIGNAGSGTISAGEIIDISNPNLQSGATIEFLSPSTYSIDGAGSFAYTAGADIDINGTRVRISGVPAAGDRFTIESNVGGIGDNRNAFNILERLGSGLFDGGTTSLQGRVGRLVTDIGIQTANANNQRDAQSALLDEIEANLDSVRGVNLDEEAADLLRYEQLYQAAAQTIAVAGSLFETVLAALRR